MQLFNRIVEYQRIFNLSRSEHLRLVMGRSEPLRTGLLGHECLALGQNQRTVQAADVNCIGEAPLITDNTVYRLRLEAHCGIGHA